MYEYEVMLVENTIRGMHTFTKKVIAGNRRDAVMMAESLSDAIAVQVKELKKVADISA